MVSRPESFAEFMDRRKEEQVATLGSPPSNGIIAYADKKRPIPTMDFTDPSAIDHIRTAIRNGHDLTLIGDKVNIKFRWGALGGALQVTVEDK